MLQRRAYAAVGSLRDEGEDSDVPVHLDSARWPPFDPTDHDA